MSGVIGRGLGFVGVLERGFAAEDEEEAACGCCPMSMPSSSSGALQYACSNDACVLNGTAGFAFVTGIAVTGVGAAFSGTAANLFAAAITVGAPGAVGRDVLVGVGGPFLLARRHAGSASASLSGGSPGPSRMLGRLARSLVCASIFLAFCRSLRFFLVVLL